MMRRMLCGAINPMMVAVRIGVRIAKSGSRTMSPGIDLYPSLVSIRSGFEHLRVLFQQSHCMLYCPCCLLQSGSLHSTLPLLVAGQTLVFVTLGVRSAGCGNCCPNNHRKGKSRKGLNSKNCRINQSYHNAE